jgi:hemerythrin-like domain-containing protein
MRPDTHEMVIIHRFIRRELRLLPALVMSVPPGQVKRSTLIAQHGLDLLDQIRIHHTGEDELLWPRLLERARPGIQMVERMQDQHADFDAAAGPVRELLTRWAAKADADGAAQLANAAEKLEKVLLSHLDEEEEHILPLAAAHLSAAEWNQLGEHGVRNTPRNRLLRQLGQILEDTSETERRAFLRKLPPPPRVLWATVGRRQYARYVQRIRAGVAAGASVTTK